jgi:hypothetical protein
MPRRVRVLKKSGKQVSKKDIEEIFKLAAQGDERFARTRPLTKKEQETIATMEKHFKKMVEHPERFKKFVKK